MRCPAPDRRLMGERASLISNGERYKKSMLLRILLALLALQLLDLYLLFSLSRSIGFWETLIIVVMTGFLGSSLARREGRRVWQGWREALQGERLPEEGIVDGMLVLLGGGLLIAPGLVTDVVGLSLLLPPTRRLIARLLRRRLQSELELRGLPNAGIAGIGGPGSLGGRVQKRAPSGGTVIDTIGEETEEAAEKTGKETAEQTSESGELPHRLGEGPR